MTRCILLLIALIWALPTKSLKIQSINNFISFMESVNSGNDYEGETVYLMNDIEFDDASSEYFEPIGTPSQPFKGTFDGLGYSIKNLQYSSTRQTFGLFGYIFTGITIRNVVIDSSCSFHGDLTASKSTALGAGFIPWCIADERPCIVENSVNMADITSITNETIMLGGIIAYNVNENYYTLIRNAVNMGNIETTSYNNYACLSGILGYFGSESYFPAYLYNNVNYGNVKIFGEAQRLIIGGILAGGTSSAFIENCVSDGDISYVDGTLFTLAAGVAPLITSGTVRNTFYRRTATVGQCNADFTNSTVSMCYYYDSSFTLQNRRSLVDSLNSYTITTDIVPIVRSDWISNKEGYTLSLSVDNRTFLAYNGQKFALLIDIVSDDVATFKGWFADDALTIPVDITTGVDHNNTYIYGTLSSGATHTITFDLDGGIGYDTNTISAVHMTTVTLPKNATKDNAIFGWWTDASGHRLTGVYTMSDEDVTLKAMWLPATINTAAEFAKFADIVNTGGTYEGYTVTLNADLDMSGYALSPIGNGMFKGFLGTFNGQGYVISNAVIEAITGYSGLFGSSARGISIKNVVVDASCKISNTFLDVNTSYTVMHAAVISSCIAIDSFCSIENTINLAPVSYNTSGAHESTNIIMAGVIGRCGAYEQGCLVRNTVNYGDVTIKNGPLAIYMGGIVGMFSTYRSSTIQNCMNNATLSIAKATKSLSFVGGIVGIAETASVENCVATGKLPSSNKVNVGAIAGYALMASLKNCYWLYNGVKSEFGYEYTGNTVKDVVKFDNALKLDDKVVIDEYDSDSLVYVLNAFANSYTTSTFSDWMSIESGQSVSFAINNVVRFVMTNKLILLPNLVACGRLAFDGWYSDRELTTAYTNRTISESVTVYGSWDDKFLGMAFYVFFDVGSDGQAIDPIIVNYGMPIDLPASATRSNAVFLGWVDVYGASISSSTTMPARNMTVVAKWAVTRISKPSHLEEFEKAVNGGVDYSGTTVYLDSDINMKGTIMDSLCTATVANTFTFDGQGHVIKNLTVRMTSKNVGLFAFSLGVTVKNLVLDSACTVENNYKSKGSVYETVLTGGIIGYCASSRATCLVDSVVDLSTVKYTGNGFYSFVGGIVGVFVTKNYDCIVRNVAKYGDVTNTGDSTFLYIGGIVANCEGNESAQCKIQCAYSNSTLQSSHKEKIVKIGGIVGEAYKYNVIENTVFDGTLNFSCTNNKTGPIFANADKSTIVNNFWNSRISSSLSENYKASYVLENYAFNDYLKVRNMNDMYVERLLNAYATTSRTDLVGWSFLEFVTNGGDELKPSIAISYAVTKTINTIPKPTKGDSPFLYWYLDKNFKEAFEFSKIKMAAPTVLYARWNDTDALTSSELESSTIKFVFSAEDEEITLDKIIEIIGCDGCYEIKQFTGGDNGALTVIIKFVDQEAAKDFVRTVKKDYSRAEIEFMNDDSDDSAAFTIEVVASFILYLLYFLFL